MNFHFSIINYLSYDGAMPTAQQTIDWYDEHAEEYAASLKGNEASPYHIYYEKPATFGLLPDLRGKSVLSLGCGSGMDSHSLKRQGASRSVGIDLSKKLIQIAKLEHPDCEFVVGNMEQLPFNNEEFDLVYSSFALHYLPSYEKALKEAFRVLKPAGVIIFSAGHPLGPSMESVISNNEVQDMRLGILKDRVAKTKKVFGNYLSNETFRTHIPEFDVTFWKQPISQTVSQLADAGFVIEKCIEPKPQSEFKKIDPMAYERLLRIPDVIVFRAKKPH